MRRNTFGLGLFFLVSGAILVGIWLSTTARDIPTPNTMGATPPSSAFAGANPGKPIACVESDELVRLKHENSILRSERDDLRKQLGELRSKAARDALLLALKAPAEESRTQIALRFTSSDALQQFVKPAPETWIQQGSELVSRGPGGSESYLLYRTFFRIISQVRIRGRIVPPCEQNFRVSVGPISLIFNWELADENHFRNGDSITVLSGHALTPGRIHTITLEQKAAEVVVRVDAREVYRTQAILEGTVTVSPAEGSVIAISELDIDGTPDSRMPVTGRSHRNTF